MSSHIPVMLPEVLAALEIKRGDKVADATFGAGGYTQVMVEAGATVLAFDRDPSAIAAGRERFAGHKSVVLMPRSFDALAEEAARHTEDGLDGAVFDLGVSSMQLDQSARGFSFQKDGPLDMRMGEGPSAAEAVAELEQDELKQILWQYGEERRAGQLAAAIVRERQKAPIESTLQLARLAGEQRANEKIHPATRMFQALRIFVNDELGQLVRALQGAEEALKAGGRLVVVTFHSLEDRIAKRFLTLTSASGGNSSRHLPEIERLEPSFSLRSRKAVLASKEEAAENPRARSAKLRAATRTEASPIVWTQDQLLKLGAPRLVFSDLQAEWSRSS
jgi:16S rRNA (cytosine1402-N4)-methyltransferase